MRGFNWASIQTGNNGDLLSVDFGMKECNEHKPKEIVCKYLEFKYEIGAADRDQMSDVRGQEDKAQIGIDPKIVDRERRRKYKISRVDRFMHRTRYFTDAGIIGSKEFVGEAPVKWKRFYGVNLRPGQTPAPDRMG